LSKFILPSSLQKARLATIARAFGADSIEKVSAVRILDELTQCLTLMSELLGNKQYFLFGDCQKTRDK